MKHLFKATKMGWAKEKEGIYFDSSTFTAEEAKQEFKEYHGTTDRGYLNITVRQSRQSGVARATCPD